MKGRGDASEPGTWPLEQLERAIGELAANIHAATCRWLGLVEEFDRREGWAEWGCKSCAQWLSWRCGLAPGAAREHVRVARRLAELPLIRAAFGRGELSYSQVRALSRVATPELEPVLLELARFASAAQLERTLRSYRGVVERELSADEQTHGERYVVCEHDDDGALLLRARLPAEEGAVVVAALAAARDGLRYGGAPAEGAEASSQGRGVSAETETPDDPDAVTVTGAGSPPSNADALLLMSETLLSNGPSERTGAESHQVVVHVDTAALAGGGDGMCELEHGARLEPETARRLACDASVVRILERDGRPLSVGRKARSVPPALRRALQSRDRCCRFPGCTQRRHLHAHHIDHWAHGGATELGNLVQLCRFHHRLVHEGGFTLERAPGRSGELWFRRPDGRRVTAPPRRAEGHSVERRNRRRGLRIGPETCASQWAGERLDLALAVDALVTQQQGLSPPAETRLAL